MNVDHMHGGAKARYVRIDGERIVVDRQSHRAFCAAAYRRVEWHQLCAEDLRARRGEHHERQSIA
jgi:hypothetical protein